MPLFRRHLSLIAGATAALLLLAGCNGASSPQLAAQNSAVLPATSQHLTLASQAEKQKPRPSITSRNVIFCNHGHSDCYRFDLITSVAVDDSGAFKSISTNCNDSIWDAPWYFADSTFTLPIASATVMNPCSGDENGRRAGDDLMQRNNQGTPTPVPTQTPSPTPIPTPTGSPSNLYLVKIDIGWSELSVAAVAGPAVVSNGQWTLPKLAADDAFKIGHLYAFFVASFDGKSCPVPVASP